MPRVTFRDIDYERKSSTSWIEKEFEDLIIAKAKQIFPRWIVVPFFAAVVSPDGVIKKPDLALIDSEYREWWIVEIELEHHDLNNHVIPQVEVFTKASYTSKHANWILERNPELDKKRLMLMMLGEAPNVLVVVDSLSTDWVTRLKDISVSLMIVEPFQNDNGEVLLRINGMQPEPKGDLLSVCDKEFSLQRLWRVKSPAALPQLEDSIKIEYDGIKSKWSIIKIKDAVYLKPEYGECLPSSLDRVNLQKQTDGSYQFTIGRKTRRAK